MAITNEEKNLWKELDENLKGVPNKCVSLDGLFRACNDVLCNMREIIRGRKDLDNKKPGVGVRGMSDVLYGESDKCISMVNFFGGTVVDDGNFVYFCECLKAISKLPRSSYRVLAWLWGGSALSEGTKRLCGEAKEALEGAFRKLSGKVDALKRLLDENSKLGGEESKKSGVYGSSGKWEKVNEMTLDALKSHIEPLQAEIESKTRALLKELLDENLKLGGEESQKSDKYGTSGKWEKVNEMTLDALKNHIESLQAEIVIMKGKSVKAIGRFFRGHVVRKKVKKEKERLVENRALLKELLNKNLKFWGKESKKSDKYGTSEEWEKVDAMALGEVEDHIRSLQKEMTEIEKLRSRLKELLNKNLKLGGKESENSDKYGSSEIWEKVDEMGFDTVDGCIWSVNNELESIENGKKGLIGELVACYKNQVSHKVEAWGNWPLVTDSGTLSEWKEEDANYYAGEFLVEYSGKEYSICVYNQKCKDNSTKEDFDGPRIVRRLNKWSNDGKNVIVVDDTENK